MADGRTTGKRKAPFQHQKKSARQNKGATPSSTAPSISSPQISALLRRQPGLAQLAMSRDYPSRLPNSTLARLASHSQNADALTLQRATVRRVDGEEGASSFPINLDRTIPLSSGYSAHLRLQATLLWNPFSIRVDGDDNGLVIQEDGEDRFNLRFGTGGEFQELGIDTGSASAAFGPEGLEETGAEMGPLSVNVEGREVTVTFDALGAVWSEAMQEMVEDVGEVTSDFNVTVQFPEEGDPRLSSISADLGLTLGPEQLQALAELSISTEYGERGVTATTAEGEISIHVNVLGFEHDFTLVEGEGQAVSVGRFGMAYEQQIVEMALRYAFRETFDDVAGLDPSWSAHGRLRYLQSGFNTWYGEGYRVFHDRVLAHFAELQDMDPGDIELYESSRRPLDIFANGIIVDRYCRQIITQRILPNPDPPGAQQVRGIWDNVIAAHESGD